MAKQEISSLEAENAESENLRVTAEIKVVDLEEQLEAVHRMQNESKLESSSEVNPAELIKQVETLTQENTELYNRISKFEEKGTSDTGSTESFEAIQELDKTDLLKKIEDLTQKNNELTLKLNKLQEKENADSIESMNNIDKNELLKKIDQLTQENSDLTMKLSRVEEKGSSDTGSTESFERIPENNESMTKIELLTQENSELVIKLTKLEEQLEYIESKSDIDLKLKIDTLEQENDNRSMELSKLKIQLMDFIEENNRLHKEIEMLSINNTDLTIEPDKLEVQIETKQSEESEVSKRDIDFKTQINVLIEEKDLLQKEVKELRNSLEQWHDKNQDLQINDLRIKIEELLRENEEVVTKMSELKTSNQKLEENVMKITQEKEELHLKLNEMLDSNNENSKLTEKLDKPNLEKQNIEEKKQLDEQISIPLEKSDEELLKTSQLDEPLSQQTESMIVVSLEQEIEKCKNLIAEQTSLIEEMKIKLVNKEKELEEKSQQIVDYEKSGKKAESLENELREMFSTIEEWKYKCNEMQEKMEKLETGKASIEEKFRTLQNENKILLEENNEKNAETVLLKKQLQDTTVTFESKFQEQISIISEKENEIIRLKETMEEKDQELQAKYTELQNKMITIDSLQDEFNNCKLLIQEKDSLITSMTNEVSNLNNLVKSKEEEIYSLRRNITELNDKMEESIPVKDYNDLMEKLKDKNMILDELECRINATTKENSNLSEKVKNLSQHNNDIQDQLTEKQRELVDLITTKDHLEAQIVKSKDEKGEAERRVWELQSIIDNNAKFVNDLQAELRSNYKQMEQLKLKHTEDTQLQNQRLENVIEELAGKMQECEILKEELEQKERLIGRNVTEEVKLALESKVADLEKKLKDSEEKIQTQLEKMKKIAANLKKKTAVCQELETRVAELEEKWTTEKDEKEAKNKQIQDVEIAIREKDNRIADLEEKLAQSRNETAQASKSIEKLTSDSSNLKEKMTSLAQQIAEMEEEIVKLRADLESSTADLTLEKESRRNILSEYESYRQRIVQESERKQLELDEMKEKARELSVRMQVMEAEYVEHLTLINDLKAENGLLLSKQAHINEKLETVEKESEERRLLLERMGKSAVVDARAEATQTQGEETANEDDAKTSGGLERCSHCEQCQTLVQALEAKLQEREAEIENLDNELANSIGNFVQMRESLRFNDLMNQTGMRNRTLEDPYNDLLFQYNSLASSHEEVKVNLEKASRENEELRGRIDQLRSTNDTLQEKLITAERVLEDSKQSVERLQNVDALNSDLVERLEEREKELLNVRQEMEIVQRRGEELERRLNDRAESLKSMEVQRETAEKLLQDTRLKLEREIESLKTDKDSNERKIKDLETELDAYKNKSLAESSREPFVTAPRENALPPQLFDASRIFGSAPTPPDSDSLADKEVKRLQALLEEKEGQCSNLTEEVNRLQATMIEERTQIDELKASQKELRSNLEMAEQLVAEKERQIDSLNVELRNLRMEQRNDTDNLEESLLAKEDQLRELNARLSSMKETLEEAVVERNRQDSLLRSYESQINNLETELKNSTDLEAIQEKRVLSLTKERDLLQLQVNDLTRSMEELKDSVNLGRSNLQLEIERVGRERDEAKEAMANLSRALEEAACKCDEATPITSTKESTPLNEDQRVGGNIVLEEKNVSLDVGGTWDAEKINVDEEIWGWNTEDAQLDSEQAMASTMLISNAEIELRAKIDDLQDQVKDLERERARMGEENKAAQLRNAKMIKKLKEYKVQTESLQRQLKIQKSASDFCGLDSAIEEELKSQIGKLEKSLDEIKEEQRNTVAEKEALMKRLDVVVSANERYMEMKERQDMDMEVLRIRNKELSEKVEILDKRLQGGATTFRIVEEQADPSATEQQVKQEQQANRGKRSADLESLSKKYKEEIDDLKDEMEALATENEQLQRFLEEQKIKLSALEAKRNAEVDESIQIVDDLNRKISELQAVLSKSREEYDLLRKQYEQSLMDANDQVTAMRQNADYLKEEAFERTGKLEMEIADLRKQLEASESNVTELRKNLEKALREKLSLEERLTDLTASSEKQVSSLNASMLEVTDLLNIRIQEVADLKQELQKQYVEHEEAKMKLQNTIHELNREFDEKRQEMENLRRSFIEKEKEFIERQSVETVSALVSQATQELMQKHAIEIEERDKHVQNLNERLSTLEIAINEYLLEKQNNVVQLEAQRQELELLRKNLMEKESSLASVRERFTSTEEQLRERVLELSEREGTIQKLSFENQRSVETIEELRERLNESAATLASLNECTLRIQTLEQEVENMRSLLDEKEAILRKNVEETTEYMEIVEKNRIELSELRMETQKVEELKNELSRKSEQVNNLSSELEATRKVLEETRQNLNEKMSLLDQSNQMLNERQMEIDRLSSLQQDRRNSTNMIDGLPVFRMGNGEQNLQHTVDNMQVELERKQEEIEHLKYILSENTYPDIIQEMQQRINCLYNEKAELESSLEVINARAEEKEKQIHALTQRIETQSQEFVSKEEASLRSRDRRSIQEQEQIVRLQNELYAKEQEINELKYIVAEKDSQLSVQASMEPQSDEFELREMVQRLTAELYGKEEEIKHVKLTIVELQREVSRLQEFERFSEQTREAVQKLNAEKEQIRLEGEEFLERMLKEKEMEIDEIKRNLAMENQKILDELSFNNRDIENLKSQLMELSTTERRTKDELRRKEEDLIRVNSDLAEKERRLAELSITKDAELHNLKIQIYEKEARIEELVSLYEEGEKRFTELKNILTAREIEINSLKTLLEDKVKEYQLIQNVLKKDVSVLDTSTAPGNMETSDEKSKTSASQELDLALYMLHQRDVRCEELTHELMQLLEERDTLQLRLSNAIRVNEDLRKGTLTNIDFSPKMEATTSGGTVEPIVEHPSPSKSEGPVEIAKEAIDAPIGENKEILAQKYVLFTFFFNHVLIEISQ